MTKRILLCGVAALLLSACANNATTGVATSKTALPLTAATIQTLVADGQLLCSKRAAASAAVAMFTQEGAAILAKGATKTAVDAVCGLVGSVAVAPDGNLVVDTSLVKLPATVVIPTKPVG